MRFHCIGFLVAGVATLISLTAQANDPSPKDLVDGSHWKRAKAALEPAAQKNPGDPQALYLLSRVRVVFGDLEGALTLAEKAAAANPASADYRWQVAVTCGEMADKKGGVGAYGLARRFKREAEAAAALDPKHIDSRWGLMEFHFRAPWIVGGSKGEARKLLEEIKRIDPARGAMAQARANLLEKKSDSPEPLYLQALEADPNYYSPMMALANYYLSQPTRKLDQSEKYARQAMKAKPGRSGPYSVLAVNFVLQQRWADVEAMLAHAEKVIPDSLSPYFNAGRAAAQEGKDLLRAERFLKKFLTMEPEPGSATHADAHYWLGISYEKMGRKADAIREIEEFLRVNPKSEQAQKDLKRLKG